MPRTRPPYPPEFRRRMVDLVRAGYTAAELSREFEPTANTIRAWVRQAGVKARPEVGAGNLEKEEIERLRREIRQLRMEWEIVRKATALSRERVLDSKRSGS